MTIALKTSARYCVLQTRRLSSSVDYRYRAVNTSAEGFRNTCFLFLRIVQPRNIVANRNMRVSPNVTLRGNVRQIRKLFPRVARVEKNLLNSNSIAEIEIRALRVFSGHRVGGWKPGTHEIERPVYVSPHKTRLRRRG